LYEWAGRRCDRARCTVGPLGIDTIGDIAPSATCTMDTRYQPPTAEVRDPQSTSSALAAKAVGLGLLVDFGAALLLNIAVVMLDGTLLQGTGISPADVLRPQGNDLLVSRQYVLLTLASCGFSVLGGYVCARIGRDRRLAIVQGLITIGLGYFFNAPSYPSIVLAPVAVLSFASVLGGAHWGLGRRPSA
jgi:hypothetical protein